MRNLYAPWRYAYLAAGRRVKGCIFCRARSSRDDAGHLVVHRGRLNFILLNRYPYNNGHLMIVPNAHLAELSRSTPPQLRDISIAMNRAGVVSVAGLPSCQASELQQTSTEAALALC